jgi:phytoene synthase
LNTSVLPTQSTSGTTRAIEAAFGRASNLAAAEAFTRRLASSHYENFSVVSVLLPKHLRQDFCNIYAFCRIADDLGDEVHDADEALKYLRQFREELGACYAGSASSAVYLALRQTILRYDIPMEPFADLIGAFEQDQRVTQYETFEELLDYCRRSANPVGRLVLYVCGYRDEERQRLSDFTCSALQLANFWQDVRRDLTELDRVYIPRVSMQKFGVSEEQLRELRADSTFRSMIEFEVKRTEEMFKEGEKLLPMLDAATRRQVALFGMGGRAILRAIRRQGYDTLTSRPSLSKWQKTRLIARVATSQCVAAVSLGNRQSAASYASRLVESYQYCREVTRSAAKNFYYGLRLLPEPKRSAMFALYAYMRMIDDIADRDDGRSVQQRADALEQWKVQTNRTLFPSPGNPGEGQGEGSFVSGDGDSDREKALTPNLSRRTGRGGQTNPPLALSDSPLWPAFADTVHRYGIPVKLFDDAIAGQQSDLQRTRFETFGQLDEYCYQVAGVVGLASIYIWGFGGREETEAMAIARGTALQLTNILRDIREDAQHGRIYLPLEDLQRFAVSEESLAKGQGGTAFGAMMEFQIKRAESFYEQSRELEQRISADSRPTLIAMTEIYHRVLAEVAADPEQVLRRRVSLSGWSKLRIGWRAARMARAARSERRAATEDTALAAP